MRWQHLAVEILHLDLILGMCWFVLGIVMLFFSGVYMLFFEFS